jgi:O-acetyl-ADP-ribose deacetylase (regulator of RNase III)
MSKMQIEIIKGDATQPTGNANKIIVHVCNDIGGWGKGFVMALSKKWKEPELQYRAWYASKLNFELGATQFVKVADNMWVANMIGQRGIGTDSNGNPPIRYDAITSALEKVAAFALEENATIHMPRIGCGLAGGKWEEIEKIINIVLMSKNIEVKVYDF